MIFGIGIDIVELKRIEKIVAENSSFIKRVLTPEEFILFQKHSKKRQVEFLAGRFACKEAFSKALGSGIGKDFSFQDLEILSGEKGEPIITKSPYEGLQHVTISHSEVMAIAQIILEK